MYRVTLIGRGASEWLENGSRQSPRTRRWKIVAEPQGIESSRARRAKSGCLQGEKNTTPIRGCNPDALYPAPCSGNFVLAVGGRGAIGGRETGGGMRDLGSIRALVLLKPGPGSSPKCRPPLALVRFRGRGPERPIVNSVKGDSSLNLP
jgi:hypothetical protein